MYTMEGLKKSHLIVYTILRDHQKKMNIYMSIVLYLGDIEP